MSTTNDLSEAATVDSGDADGRPTEGSAPVDWRDRWAPVMAEPEPASPESASDAATTDTVADVPVDNASVTASRAVLTPVLGTGSGGDELGEEEPAWPGAGLGRAVSPMTPVFVGSGVGGAGCTVATLLLAAALGDRGVHALAVDGTATGGDLHRRAGFGEGCPAWQDWIERGAHPDELPEPTRPQVPVLRRDPLRPDYRSPLAATIEAVRAAGRVPVVDLGASLGSAHTRDVLERGGLLVVVVPDRADAANRFRATLTALANQVGVEQISRIWVVVTGQSPSFSPAWFTLREHLAPRVAGVHSLDYEPALAWGQDVDASFLASRSQTIATLAEAAQTTTLSGAGQRR